MAEELHARARVRGPPYDISEVARSLGYRVKTSPDLGGPVGILVARTIVVLDDVSPEAFALTVGHELAHTLSEEWHRLLEHLSPAALELHMDAVAAAVLMPRADVAKAIVAGTPPDSVRLGFGPVPPEWAWSRLRGVLVGR